MAQGHWGQFGLSVEQLSQLLGKQLGQLFYTLTRRAKFLAGTNTRFDWGLAN